MDLKMEELMDSTMVKMKGIPREMHLDYHLEMTMGSQMDLKKEDLMDSMMVKMKGIPTEMHLEI